MAATTDSPFKFPCISLIYYIGSQMCKTYFNSRLGFTSGGGTGRGVELLDVSAIFKVASVSSNCSNKLFRSFASIPRSEQIERRGKLTLNVELPKHRIFLFLTIDTRQYELSNYLLKNGGHRPLKGRYGVICNDVIFH